MGFIPGVTQFISHPTAPLPALGICQCWPRPRLWMDHGTFRLCQWEQSPGREPRLAHTGLGVSAAQEARPALQILRLLVTKDSLELACGRADPSPYMELDRTLWGGGERERGTHVPSAGWPPNLRYISKTLPMVLGHVSALR